MQVSTSSRDAYAQRSRYLTLDQGFNQNLPPVPAHIFLDERDQALGGAASSAHILCDQSLAMASPVAATAPLLLASYLRLAPGQPLALRSGGSTEVFYVIRGCGATRWGDDRIDWEAGDVMLLPGGTDQVHTAEGDGNAVLWRCTNEPQLAYESARPAPAGRSPIQPALFPRAAMMDALMDARTKTMKNGMRSMAIMLSTAQSAYNRIGPSLTLAFNSVPPNDSQVPHRHNSVAVTLVLQGKQCHSMVDGQRVPWSDYATFVTPAGASHSHHNEAESGDALVLIVQDGGLYYHCRTMGFAITEA